MLIIHTISAAAMWLIVFTTYPRGQPNELPEFQVNLKCLSISSSRLSTSLKIKPAFQRSIVTDTLKTLPQESLHS